MVCKDQKKRSYWKNAMVKKVLQNLHNIYSLYLDCAKGSRADAILYANQFKDYARPYVKKFVDGTGMSDYLAINAVYNCYDSIASYSR